MQQQLAALAVVGVILLAGVGALSAQYEQSVTGSNAQDSISGESFTVSKPGLHTFNESNRDVIYNETVTVYDSSGTVVSEDGNYSWNDGNGTLYVPSGSTLNDSESATIDYQFTVPDNSQRAVRDTGMILPGSLGGTITLALGLAVVLGSLWIIVRIPR